MHFLLGCRNINLIQNYAAGLGANVCALKSLPFLLHRGLEVRNFIHRGFMLAGRWHLFAQAPFDMSSWIAAISKLVRGNPKLWEIIPSTLSNLACLQCKLWADQRDSECPVSFLLPKEDLECLTIISSGAWAKKYGIGTCFGQFEIQILTWAVQQRTFSTPSEGAGYAARVSQKWKMLFTQRRHVRHTGEDLIL